MWRWSAWKMNCWEKKLRISGGVKEPLRAVQVRRFLREQGVAEFKITGSRRVRCVTAADAGW